MPLRVSVLVWQTLDTLCKLAGSPGFLGVSRPYKGFTHRAVGFVDPRQDNPLKAVFHFIPPSGIFPIGGGA